MIIALKQQWSESNFGLIKQIIIQKKAQEIEKNLHIFFYFIVVAWQVDNGDNSKIYCVLFKVELCFNRVAEETCHS
jgi:hypothetical protein